VTISDGRRTRIPRAGLLVAAALLGSLALCADWRIAAPDYAWSFPRDHWAHEGYRTEWWYFTGHLEARDEPGRVFGYQFTMFRIGILPERPPLRSEWAARNLIMGHAAVSDLGRGEHRFSDLLRREVPLLGTFGTFPDPVIAKVLAAGGACGPWTLRWSDGGFDLEMQDDERRMAFRLSTRPVKPLVLEGPNGYSRKGEGPTAASQYYSFTRLATEGSVVLDGRTYAVRGESWMDREFGSSQLSREQVGWDWFALKLEDGRDLMLYLMRRGDGTEDFRNGTLVERNGEARVLSPSEWSVRVLATWRSRETGATYPARWVVDVPSAGVRLDVRPDFPDQENRGRVPHAPFYWEGSVAVRDADARPAGRGYVELTGYGERNRPPV
jgi:predicted secreted hydrolase